MSIAKIIVQQLGGGWFVAMTGAKKLYELKDGLQFSLPSNFAKDKINLITIKLNGSDLYDVTYYYARGDKLKLIKEDNDVYAEDLARFFEDATGLYAHL